MLDVTRRFRLALSDLGRRSALVAGAGLAGLVAAGFLLAALWSWLAHGLGWGPALASLAIAGLCLVVAGVLLALARNQRHAMPTGGDVKAEVEARAHLAKEAAIGAVKARAGQARDAAGQHLHGIWDGMRYRADRAAGGLDSAAASLAETAARATARAAGHGARRPGAPDSAGPGAAASPALGEVAGNLRELAETFARSRAAPGVALASAFAIGLTLAGIMAGDDEDEDEGGDPA